MYQYLSWFKRGQAYPSGNKLQSLDSINKLKPALLSGGVEVHESVQRYDSLGRVLFTPIYADFDGENHLDDVLRLIDAITFEFGITPDIYFTGNRGFHIFINIPVSHTYPHLVVRKFMTIMCPRLSDKDPYKFDDQMYASRHLLRSEGSIHFKSNLYKVKITKAELIDGSYKAKAKKQIVTQPTNHESHLLDLFINSLSKIVDKEVKEAEEKYAQAKSEMSGEVPTCITALIKDGPVPGSNNQILTIIARSYNQSGIALEDAITSLTSKPIWMTKVNDIKSTFKSIYKQQSRFGCKGNKLLKDNCDPFCPFNESTINIT